MLYLGIFAAVLGALVTFEWWRRRAAVRLGQLVAALPSHEACKEVMLEAAINATRRLPNGADSDDAIGSASEARVRALGFEPRGALYQLAMSGFAPMLRRGAGYAALLRDRQPARFATEAAAESAMAQALVALAVPGQFRPEEFFKRTPHIQVQQRHLEAVQRSAGRQGVTPMVPYYSKLIELGLPEQVVAEVVVEAVAGRTRGDVLPGEEEQRDAVAAAVLQLRELDLDVNPEGLGRLVEQHVARVGARTGPMSAAKKT